MKAVVQRVSRARVVVDGRTVGEVGAGLVVLLGILREDGEGECRRLAERVADYRMFPDEAGHMNHSLVDVGGTALVVSQVTLAADPRRGRRPSFDAAAEPARARALYDGFVDALRARGVPTETGEFGASMSVELVNEGPVTFLLEAGGRPPEAEGRSSQVLA